MKYRCEAYVIFTYFLNSKEHERFYKLSKEKGKEITNEFFINPYRLKYKNERFPEVFVLKEKDVCFMGIETTISISAIVFKENVVSIIIKSYVVDEKENLMLYPQTIILSEEDKKYEISEYVEDFVENEFGIKLGNRPCYRYLVMRFVDESPILFLEQEKEFLSNLISKDLLDKNTVKFSNTEIMIYSQDFSILITTERFSIKNHILVISMALSKYLLLDYYEDYTRRMFNRAQDDVNYVSNVPFWKVFFDKRIRKMNVNIARDRSFLFNSLKYIQFLEKLIKEHYLYLIYKKLDKLIETDSMFINISKELEFLNQIYTSIQNTIYSKEMFFIQMIFLAAVVIKITLWLILIFK